MIDFMTTMILIEYSDIGHGEARRKHWTLSGPAAEEPRARRHSVGRWQLGSRGRPPERH